MPALCCQLASSWHCGAGTAPDSCVSARPRKNTVKRKICPSTEQKYQKTIFRLRPQTDFIRLVSSKLMLRTAFRPPGRLFHRFFEKNTTTKLRVVYKNAAASLKQKMRIVSQPSRCEKGYFRIEACIKHLL